jgi:S-DNA-T family DNA segregation ATPase FtsK/SpoIIIE
VALVMAHNKVSTSMVQRHLKLGYNRVARMLAAMECEGLISTHYVNGYRRILQSNVSTETVPSTITVV